MSSTPRRILHLVAPLYFPGDVAIEKARWDLCWEHPAVERVRKRPDIYTKPVQIFSFGSPDLVLGKGLAVRFQFRQRVDAKDDDIVMLIDGTGKIDFSAVEQFVQRFDADPEVGFLFAQRSGSDGTWAMTPERKEIELFENYLILNALMRMGLLQEDGARHLRDHQTKQFLDLQCGCWAFRGQHFNSVRQYLTAFHYDLEVDIFVAAFKVWNEPKHRGKEKFLDFMPVRLAGKDEPLTKQVCERALERFRKHLDAADLVSDVEIGRIAESARLLAGAKQSNFQFKDNMAKLAAISLSLGITRDQYIEARADGRRLRGYPKPSRRIRSWENIAVWRTVSLKL